MGLLTNNGPPDWHPADHKLKVKIFSRIGDLSGILLDNHERKARRLIFHYSIFNIYSFLYLLDYPRNYVKQLVPTVLVKV